MWWSGVFAQDRHTMTMSLAWQNPCDVAGDNLVFSFKIMLFLHFPRHWDTISSLPVKLESVTLTLF
jgi:hypothetical protein